MNTILNVRPAWVCLLGAALLSGCESDQPRPVAARPMLPTTVTLSKAPDATTTPMVAAQVKVDVKVPAETSKPGDSPTLAITTPAPEIRQTGLEPSDSATAVQPQAPARKSFVDITARSCFAHAEDYSWVSGELQYSHLSKAWRLRYASVDEVDPWGGSVTLVCDRPSSELKDGICVRVSGHIDESAGKNMAPPYQVESIRIIEKPDQAKAD